MNRDDFSAKENTDVRKSVNIEMGTENNSSYIELTNDLLFHMVFTKNEKALRDLLSSLLGLAPDSITKIEILNPMQYNDSLETKLTILDLKIHLNSASFILVEMQVRNYKFWTNRAIIYACRQIDEQTKGKQAYTELQPVIQISIMKHALFPEHRRFYTEYKIQDDEHQLLTDKLRFYVLDLSAIDQANDDQREQGLVQWAEAFNARDWKTVKEIDRPGIQEAANTMEMILANPTQRQLLWERKLALMDYNTEIMDARNTGRMEGRAEGRLEGHAEGRLEGRAEGHSEGVQETNRRNAEGMKRIGVSPLDIAKITGLSVEEIEAL